MQNYIRPTKRVILILVVILSVKVASSEPTNFDYDKHGSDWTGDCSKNGNILFYLATQQSPIILPAPANVQSDKSSYVFADFRKTPGTATVLNTTIYIKPESTS
jgi:hypothetical protein